MNIENAPNKTTLLHKGKSKSVYLTTEKDILIQHFRNDLTAQNGKKHSILEGKGRASCKFSSLIFKLLSEHQIPNHFIKEISDTEQLIKSATTIPIEVVVRNIAAGSIVKRYNLPDGQELSRPLVELFFKSDITSDPLINDDHAILLNLIKNKDELNLIKDNALKINTILQKTLASINILLVDFKLEFGYNASGDIILIDEISQDSCRLWDAQTKTNYDKDIFRNDIKQDIVTAYESILSDLTKHLSQD